ncbi:MAG: hypothetical protein IKN36_08615 [Clostridia bacterium]|nr:hypothetical protein [Clostridia bacterium]MBR7033458.1 hypothetical protein [Clostridia bacterium]
MDKKITRRAPSGRVSETGISTRVPHEVTDEVVLPDYLPPVGRIVSFSAAALDENRFLDPPALETSGLLACSVTYAGDGGEIVSYPVNCDFSLKIPVGDAGDGETAQSFFVRTDVESSVCRATAPRKVSVSAKLTTSVFSVRSSDVTARVAADGGERENEASVEYRSADVPSSSVVFLKKTGETTGEVPVPVRGAEDGEQTKIINCAGTSYVTGVSPAPDSVTVRGETVVSCLVLTPDGEYKTVSAKAPFEEKLPADFAVPPEGEPGAAAFVRCASVNVSEAGGVYVFSAEHDVDAELWHTASTPAATDAFSTEFASEVMTRETCPVTFCGGVASTFSASGSARMPGGGDRFVISTCSRATPVSSEVTENGTLILSGQCTVTAAVAGDGKAEPVDVTFPVRFEYPLRRACDKPTVRWDAAVVSADARPDGERLNVTAEIAVSAAVTETGKIQTVETVKTDEKDPVSVRRSSVRVFFPDGETSEWDVLKKFRADPDDVTVLRGADDPTSPLPKSAAVIVNGR